MDKRNNAYLYITCFIVSIGGLLLGISANVSEQACTSATFSVCNPAPFRKGWL